MSKKKVIVLSSASFVFICCILIFIISLPSTPTALTEVEPNNTLAPTETSVVPTSALTKLSPTLTTETSCSDNSNNITEATVVGIVDGDTINVVIGNELYIVRYIGIDTPEKGDTGYEEAKLINKNLLKYRTVTLIQDISNVDKYNRLLRYVWANNVFVNAKLISSGYATAMYYEPDIKCHNLFEKLESDAQAAQVGLWTSTTPTIPIISNETTETNCDPSYPGVCIPPAPPELNCGDIPYKNFIVLPPDPHGFDKNYDGIGCEN